MTTIPDTNTTSPEPTEEIWVFGGTRVLGGKKSHAWLPAGANPGQELYFKPQGSPVPGSEYRVRVTRTDGHTVRHGAPVYHGRHGDDAVRAGLELASRAAETVLRRMALERNDKRHSALDAALVPLCDLIRKAPAADRDAIVAYVLRHLSRAW
jgi:hypothetical protein